MTDKTVTSTEDTDKTMPPDWAIEEAIKRVGGLWSCEEIERRREETAPRLIIFAARLIAQHEQPPVDPLLQIARDIVADLNKGEGFLSDFSAEVRKGQHDGNLEFLIAMAALKHGIEIGKADAS